MIDIAKINQNLTEEMNVLEFEVVTLNTLFQETNFFEHTRNFPNAHYGYLMVCMSKIDLVSLYWEGQNGLHQTERMIDFMDKYLHPGKNEENRIAVQMFRHTLMHTGELRFLYDEETKSAFTWRVHFGEKLSSNLHYSITVEDEKYQNCLLSAVDDKAIGKTICKSLNLSILRFVGDLKICTQRYLDDLENNHILQANCVKAHQSVVIQKVKHPKPISGSHIPAQISYSIPTKKS